MIPGSYANGFAPRDAEPLYPQLWKGCVGAWCPSLGPSGGVLRDWSGRQLNGTLTGMTLANAWAVSSGGYSLAFSGASQYVTTTINAQLNGLRHASLSLWFRRASSGAIINIGKAQALSRAMAVEIYSDGFVYLEPCFGGAGQYGYFASNDTNWHNLAMLLDGDGGSDSLRLTAWLDGIQQSLTFPAAIGTILPTLDQPFEIGKLLTGYSTGNVDDVRLYDRLLNRSDIGLLRSSRGVAYAMSDESYYGSQAGRIPSGATMTGGMYHSQCGGMVA